MEPKKPKKTRSVRSDSAYDESYCEKLIAHMSEGYSFASFAGVVGVARNTLYKWAQRHPEFQKAKEIASMKCLLHWETIGANSLVTDKSTSFNSTVWIFNMKNRFGWTDRMQDVEQNPDSYEDFLESLAKEDDS